MKKIIIIIIPLAILAGASYWYVQIYQPKQFAKEFIIIYRDFQVGVRGVISNQPKQNGDEKTWIKKYKAVVINTRAKLIALKPPRKMKSIHLDFVELLDAFDLFVSNFEFGNFNQAVSDKEQELARRGNDLDSKIQELIRTYPELKSLTE